MNTGNGTHRSHTPTDPAELLRGLLVEDEEVSDFLHSLAATSARHLSDGHDVLCGVLLTRARANAVVASSGPEARRMDEVQAGFDEGPCLDSQRTGTTIYVSDIADEDRWPDYLAEVSGHGMKSIIAIPLALDGAASASMNFYSRRPEAFDSNDIDSAESYARLAEKTLLVALRVAAYSDDARDRRAAMESRTAIDIAVGIVMAHSKVGRDEAFATLQRLSSHRNVRLRDLAEEIVIGVGKSPPTTAFDQ